MKKLILYSLMFLSFLSSYSQIPDSSIIQPSIFLNSSLLQPGDTLINLNKLNGGIVKFQISDEDKQILKRNGLQLSEQAVIIVNDPSLLAKKVMFEIKTFASDKEWYINTVKIETNLRGILVYVSSDKIEMATGWRKDGKIYVLIAVVFVLFLGIIAYLFVLDRKIDRLMK